MAYDIDLTPKVVDSEDLDNLEDKIKKIEEQGIKIKAKEDDSLSNIKDKLKKLEEEGISLEVKLIANNAESTEEVKRNISAISKLIQQLNTLAGFKEEQLNKNIDLHVNVDNLTKQISEGLAVLNKINPEIAFDTAKLRDSFRKFKNEYNAYYKELDIMNTEGVMSGLANYTDIKNLDEFWARMQAVTDTSKDMYRTLLAIDELLKRDPSLGLSYDPKKEQKLDKTAAMFYRRMAESVEVNSEDFYKDYTESLKNEIKELQEELKKSDEPDKAIKKTLDSKTKALETFEKKYRAILSEFGDERLSRPVTDKELFKDQPKSVWEGVKKQTKKDGEEVGGSFDSIGDQAESFIDRFEKAITKLHSAMDSVGTDVNSIADNIKKLKTILDEMNQAVQQIKSPFDETSISNTATRLEELFKQYNSLDGTEKEMKIGVEISSEDEQKLKNVAKYADEIKSVMRNITTYKAIGSGQDSQGNNKSSKKKEQKESTDSQSGVANKESKKAVAETNKAVEAYDKLVPKEVKITLNVENLNDLETAVSHIKELDQRNENIAQDAVTSVKPKIQSGVSKPSNAKGNITPNNGSSRNNAPTDPDVSAKLQNILTTEDQIVDGLKDVDDKLKSILNIISSSEKISSIVDKVVNKLEELKTPLSTQDSLSNNTSITNDSSDSFKDGDDAYILQHPDGFEKVFHTLHEAYKWIARANLSQISNAFITKGKIKDGNFDEDDVIEKVTEERLHEILTQFGNAQSQAYEIFRSALSKFEQPLQNLTDKIDNLQSYYDQTDKTNLGTIEHNIWYISDLLKNNIGSFTSQKSPDPNNDWEQGDNNDTLRSSGEGGSEKQSLISTLIDPKLSAIQTAVTNIDNKIANTETSQKEADKNVTPPASQGNTPASPNAVTKNDYTNLETAIKALTQTLSTPTATGGAQNAQNNATAPSTAQAAANLANASSLQTQATNRIKELQTVLGFMNGGSFSSIFGSTQDIESYIVSLETLNKEIASAGKMLNRNDISAAQRSNTEQKLSTNTAILNGYINGDDSLGINATQIANINALLQAMTTINSRITGADAAFEGLTKLKETLKSYDITVQPLQAAIDNLKATRENLKQMSDKISSSSLTEQEFANLQTAITSAETSYQEAINKSDELLNTNQKDSLQSITSEFNQAQQEVTKYSAKIEKLKNFLRDLKAKKIDLSTIDMGNGRTAKDMEAFLADYEKAIALKHNFNSTQEMQTYAANFVANYQTPLKQYVDGLGEANRQFKNMTQAASESIRHNNFGKQLADFTTSVKKWGDTNSGVFSRAEFKDRYNKIMTELTSGSVQSADQLARLRSEFANLKLAANQAGVAAKSFTAKLKEMYKKYGGWTLVTKTLNTAMRLLRSMVTQVKEVDTAMTNLKKVTEATGNQLNTFLESAGKRSVALGASLTDYVDAVSEFSRLGKSLDEAQKLGELATTYKTVAEDLDIKTASKSIISTMQAFNSVGVQADEIVDKFNYVGKMLPLITISVKVQRWIRPS